MWQGAEADGHIPGPEREISVLGELLLTEVRRFLATRFQAKFIHMTPLASCVQSSCVLSWAAASDIPESKRSWATYADEMGDMAWTARQYEAD